MFLIILSYFIWLMTTIVRHWLLCGMVPCFCSVEWLPCKFATHTRSIAVSGKQWLETKPEHQWQSVQWTKRWGSEAETEGGREGGMEGGKERLTLTFGLLEMLKYCVHSVPTIEVFITVWVALHRGNKKVKVSKEKRSSQSWSSPWKLTGRLSRRTQWSSPG